MLVVDDNMDKNMDSPHNKKNKKVHKMQPNKKFKGNKERSNEKSNAQGSMVTKNMKRKLSEKGTETVEKKPKLFQLKKKERRVIRKQKDHSKTFERTKHLKALWEELRQDNCKPKQRNDLLEKSFKLISGHAKELIFAHDTVRALECIFGLGNVEQKNSLFEEIKDSILIMAKSKYAKFFLIKVLRNGSKDQKNQIVKDFHGKVVELISHSEAAEVLEISFNECASSSQRIELVQEFFGPEFRYFKEPGFSLKKVLEKDPEKKLAIIQYMKESIIKLTQKSVIRHSIVHYILREFLIHADKQSCLDVIEAIRQFLVEMLHTKDGARAAMFCVWHGTAKDRKAIIKSFKTHVSKVAMEEHGHLVLLSLFDCVDDTKLVEKHIIAELLSNILVISDNLYGRKVLLYLISPRDKLHFCPDIIKILEEGDNNETSKKDAEKRRSELRQCIISPLVKLVVDRISELYHKDNAFCLATLTICKHAAEYGAPAYEAIAKLVALEYSNDVKNMHIIESSGSSFMLKKLINEDKHSESEVCFSKVLVETASSDAMKSWTNCNRGCFLLVGLLETEIPAVVKTVKETLYGHHSKLSKKSFSGAAILLKKLKL